MNISSYSIKNPIPTILLFIILTVLGIVSFRSMIIQEYPDIELPVVVINSVLPGASPEQLEHQVARKIENASINIPAVKHVYSLINNSVVNTIIELQLGSNSSDVMNELRDMLDRVRSDLPSDLREQTLAKINTAGRPVLTYVADSPSLSALELSWWVDNTIAKSLQSIKGVGSVTRVGGVRREVRVEVDPIKLAAYDISAVYISQQIERMQRESTGGTSDIGGVEQNVRILGTLKSAEEIAALNISLPNGKRIRLDQVAKVADTAEKLSSIALLDGREVVSFEVTRAKGASEIEVAERVRDTLKKLQEQNPNIALVEAFNGVDPVTDAYSGSMQLLYEGALLAVLVVWIFLRNWRATAISVLALPLSIIPTFAFIHAMGFSLNTVTLQSLALVVGILVDDAIVEIENIVRHLRAGKTPWQAAMDAVDEIGLAVVATTFTLVAVFLPTIFMSGVTGKFFVQFGWTASISIIFSLLVARMLTPILAAYFLKPILQQEHQGSIIRLYLRCAHWCLRHRLITLGSAAVLFIASLALIPLLPTGFLPQADRSQTMVSVELPPGSTLAESVEVVQDIREQLTQHDNVKQIYSTVGAGFAGGNMFASSGPNSVRKATLTVNLVDRQQREKSQSEIENEFRKTLATYPGVRLSVGTGSMGEQLTLVFAGSDSKQLSQAAQDVIQELRGIAGVGNISSSDALATPELVVKPKFAQAAELGVSTYAIGEALRIATAGDYEQVLSKLNLAENQVPIRVRLPDAALGKLDVIENLRIPGSKGNVMLKTVADFSLHSGPEQINRYDGKRVINITLELNGRALGQVLQDVNSLPIMKNLPQGVEQVTGGDAEVMSELFADFAVAMLMGILCIYMILVLLFKDFLQPITIIAALPLSVGGAFAALLLTQQSLSMPSLIGLLMLMGIAVKNSILLVEYTVIARHRDGLNRFDALMDACSKRARPIVMTSLAMGAGMLPVAMGMGADPSFRVPMAVVIIGGLVTSTALSLLVIPVVFTYVDDFGKFIVRCMRGSGLLASQASEKNPLLPKQELLS